MVLNWPTQDWYPNLMRLSSSRSTDAAKGKTSAETAIQTRSHSSPAFKVSTSGLSLVRGSLCEKGLRENPSNHHGIQARLKKQYA